MAVDLATLSKSIPSSSNQPAQDIHKLWQVFASTTSESCPSHYNFHMHTVASDGRLQPEQLAEQAVMNGLQGFAITDHHSIGGFLRAQEWLAQNAANAERPHLWSGLEINAGLLDCEVHILCYGFDPDRSALQRYTQGHSVAGVPYRAESVIKAAHEAGGLAVLAHPSRYRQPAATLIPEAARLGIDGVETYYAYDNPTPWRPSPKRTALARELGDRFGLLHTCGTDTHGLSLLRRI
ncbi:MAG: PHP domain-containing protein [Cyanobacteria bacterium P01_A01_bin.135]